MAGMFGSVDNGVSNAASKAAFKQNLNKVYTWYTGGFLVFLIARKQGNSVAELEIQRQIHGD